MVKILASNFSTEPIFWAPFFENGSKTFWAQWKKSLVFKLTIRNLRFTWSNNTVQYLFSISCIITFAWFNEVASTHWPMQDKIVFTCSQFEAIKVALYHSHTEFANPSSISWSLLSLTKSSDSRHLSRQVWLSLLIKSILRMTKRKKKSCFDFKHAWLTFWMQERKLSKFLNMPEWNSWDASWIQKNVGEQIILAFAGM